MHAEATSEKVAMGWYLDGRVSAVIGSHTHIPTADETILPGGTAYQTDAGMTGPFHSVIGVMKEAAINRFLTQMPERFEPASQDVRLKRFVIDVDERNRQGTKYPLRIQRESRDATMFDTLSEKLQRIFKNLKGEGRITEEHLEEP